MPIPRSVDWDLPGVRAAREVKPKKVELPTKVVAHASPKMLAKQLEWLTPVQLELVRLLSIGMDLKEIAAKQRYSVGTLKVYLFQARRRTGSRNTYQLVADYVRRVECPARSATPVTNS